MDAVIDKARTRLLALKASRDAGKLDAAAYETQRHAVERELGDHLLGDAGEPAARPSLGLISSVVVAVLAIAAVGYWKTGSPSLARVNPVPDTAQRVATAPERSASDASGLQQIAAMVETLAARMKERPDDAQGWTMLARSYTVLGRFDDALPAYKRATELLPKNAVLLADYADAVAATRGGANNPESNALVERALAVDPRQPKALALAGTSAYDRGDYSLAVARWTTMQAQLPPDSELGKQVQASIDDARAHLGPGAGAAATTPPGNAPAVEAPVLGAVANAPATHPPSRRPGRASRAPSRSILRSRARCRPPTPSSSTPAPRAAAACRSRCSARPSPTCR